MWSLFALQDSKWHHPGKTGGYTTYRYTALLSQHIHHLPDSMFWPECHRHNDTVTIAVTITVASGLTTGLLYVD